ncbi:uncharacterized protein LOC144450013 [Glandiceps talaboti]
MPDTQPTPQQSLEKLKAARSAHRGHMTRLLEKGEEDMEHTGAFDATVLQTLRANRERILSKYTELINLDKEIYALAEAEELAAIIDESETYLDRVHTKQFIYCDFVNNKTREISTEPSTTQRNSEPPAQLQSSDQPRNPTITRAGPSTLNQAKNFVNLPKLTLPTFSGDLLKWVSFKDEFASVHENPNLDNIHKFQYLRSQLRGEAARAIEGISLNNANYGHAMTILEERYGQTHEVADAYMRAFYELPAPNAELYSLRDFHDTIETYVRALSTLGKEEDIYGQGIAPILMDKLPDDIRERIAREHGNAGWKMSQLRDAIGKEVHALRARSSRTLIGQERKSDFETPVTAAFYTKGASDKPQKTRLCAFCKGPHLPNECNIVTDKEKRLDIVKRDKLCFNCLGKHRVNDCKSKFCCRTCKRKHHTSLCKGITPTKDADTSTANSEGKQIPAQTTTQVTLSSAADTDIEKGQLLLQTAVAQVTNASGDITATATILFDLGATRSFVTTDLAKRLKAKPTTSRVTNLATFGDDDSRTRKFDVTTLSIRTINGGKCNISAMITPKIAPPTKNLITRSLVDLPHLRDLTLAHPASEINSFEISILIGIDYFWKLVGNHIVRGPGPIAMSSSLGYILSGSVPIQGENDSIFTTILDTDTDIQQDDVYVHQYWDLETIGIHDTHNTTDNSDIDFDSYRATHLRIEDGKYVAKLPWKSDHPPLPSNYHIAEKRTRSLARRLTPQLLQVYDRIIRDQETRDFIEEVTDDDITHGHYLPHHSVKKDSTTTPIRIVYDCSCTPSKDTPSLNDCLQTGPTLLNDLTAILLRFRLNNIAIVSDIEKAFLNVRLDQSDRDFTKFLWLSNPNDPESLFKVYRFKSVLFGAVCSPFILNAVVKTHLETHAEKWASNDLSENMYVDNVVTGTEDAQEARKYYTDANEIMQTGGFKLRSWSSNYNAIRSLAERDGKLEENTNVSVLGLRWDTDSDKLSYANKMPLQVPDTLITKREVAKITASLFDPLGYLSPITVKAKRFIQELWKQKVAWDEPLDEELSNQWQEIATDLQVSSSTSISRQYFSDNPDYKDVHELHVFADASPKAYGAAVYLCNKDHASLIMSKTRVAPLKEMTLPRLELMATLIGSRLIKFVYNALKDKVNIARRVLWSDSQIVIHWIQGKKKLPVFVNNHVREINEFPCEIKYCPTADNPADLVTRGISTQALQNSSLFWSGPIWLRNGDWPVCELFDSAINHVSVSDNDLTDTTIDHDTSPTTTTQSIGIQRIINIDRFGSLPKLLRVTAHVLRFIARMKRDDSPKTGQQPDAEEIQQAEHKWIQDIQREEYRNEIHSLQKESRKLGHLARQLKLFVDERGTLRCGGRLHNAPLDFTTKFQILLPTTHRFTYSRLG